MGRKCKDFEQQCHDFTEEETLGHLLQLADNQLNVESSLFDDVFKEFDGQDGFSDEVLEKKLNLLKERVGNLFGSNANKKQIQTELAFVEVCAVIHKIFIQQSFERNSRLVLGTEERRKDGRKRSLVLWLDVSLHQAL